MPAIELPKPGEPKKEVKLEKGKVTEFTPTITLKYLLETTDGMEILGTIPANTPFSILPSSSLKTFALCVDEDSYKN
ncbi:hypothetical protein [Geobacter sulfurreducens]|uniref:hypothetical protein n=1 Tax=Geobacter sulfurreducens TaxID=35554 RepID=UPI0020B72314|nr:hypothetical protein [Geobacter sulfurreducens]UTG93651.1 hypothetical protein J8622_04815 [Geobacter sulfurreducens]